ncbi:MAG: 2OG-Fe(II) oxygenase [Myxococcales bacterium]
MIDPALPAPLFHRARRAIGQLGTEGLRRSSFTTFWLPRGEKPAHAVEEAVLALSAIASPAARWSGAEWWIGRAYTTDLPIGFHFDEDVHGSRMRHPLISSVLFFNSVRGGHLAVTDQRPGSAEATRLATVKPRANRYAVFEGDRFHGVLDARGRTPGRRLPGPRGRLRVTLVVNLWERRPTGVPEWGEARRFRSLASVEVRR